MKRSLALSMALAVAACAGPPPQPATTFAPRPQSIHGNAYADVDRLVREQPAYAAVLAYDRQIATLRALMFPSQHVDAGAAQRHAERAVIVATSAGQAAAPSDSRQMLDPATVAALMRRRYAEQATVVRNHAGDSSATYLQILQQEQGDAISTYARALETRVERAYANRTQQLREQEANNALERERTVANQRLVLAVKLRNLRPNTADRQALESTLAAIDRSLQQANDKERATDVETLALYQSTLRDQAVRALTSGADTIGNDARANWQTRVRVADVQTQIPRSLAIGSLRDESPAPAAAGAQAIATTLRSAGNDISRQTQDDIAADERDRVNAAQAIANLERERTLLYRSVVAYIRKRAHDAAALRGLRLVDRRSRGAIDITSSV
jgi:hypothetical protein